MNQYKHEPKAGRLNLCYLARLVRWLDTKLDHYAEMPASEFTRKCDAMLCFITHEDRHHNERSEAGVDLL